MHIPTYYVYQPADSLSLSLSIYVYIFTVGVFLAYYTCQNRFSAGKTGHVFSASFSEPFLKITIGRTCLTCWCRLFTSWCVSVAGGFHFFGGEGGIMYSPSKLEYDIWMIHCDVCKYIIFINYLLYLLNVNKLIYFFRVEPSINLRRTFGFSQTWKAHEKYQHLQSSESVRNPWKLPNCHRPWLDTLGPKTKYM